MVCKPLFAIALAGGIGLLAGCAAPFVPPPVPASVVEVIPNPPVSATPLIWQPGHWDWSGTSYVWQTGQYVPRAGHGNLYMPGYWALTDSGYRWQPPHWM